MTPVRWSRACLLALVGNAVVTTVLALSRPYDAGATPVNGTANGAVCDAAETSVLAQSLEAGDCVTSSVTVSPGETVIGTQMGLIGTVSAGQLITTRPPGSSGAVTDMQQVYGTPVTPAIAVSFVVDQGVGVFVVATRSVLAFTPDVSLSPEGVDEVHRMLTDGTYFHTDARRLSAIQGGYYSPDPTGIPRTGFGFTSSGAICVGFLASDGAVPHTVACSDAVLGAAEVDAVIMALLNRDVDTLASHARLSPVGCSTTTTIDAPPTCAPGERLGSPHPVFRFAGCEGTYVDTVDAIGNVFLNVLSRSAEWSLYKTTNDREPTTGESVMRVALNEGAQPDGSRPGIVVTIDESGGITGISTGCANSVADMVGASSRIGSLPRVGRGPGKPEGLVSVTWLLAALVVGMVLVVAGCQASGNTRRERE